MGTRNSVAPETKRLDGAALGRKLGPLDAAARVKLLGERFPGQVMATSSFGLQAAVMLHLMKENAPHVPIVFIDTGYLFPETYRYVEVLQGLFGFEALTYAPRVTAARRGSPRPGHGQSTPWNHWGR